MSNVLSEDDLFDVTGTKEIYKQARVLKRAGIFFWFAYTKKIKTTWHYVNNSRIAIVKDDGSDTDKPEESYLPDFSNAH